MIAEVQRIRRRTRARLGPVLALAAAITLLITYRLATRVTMVEAEVVLALTEGTLSAKRSGLPVEELREFVGTVLIPDSKLLELVKRRDLYPQRERLGDQVAIDELREQIEVSIWKNSFVTYDEDAEEAEHSARIGLTFTDADPDRAFDIVRDLGSIVIESAQAQRQQLAKSLSAESVEIARAADRARSAGSTARSPRSRSRSPRHARPTSRASRTRSISSSASSTSSAPP